MEEDARAKRHKAGVSLDVSIKLTSGETLTSVACHDFWTLARLKEAVQQHLKPSTHLQELVLGDQTLADDSQTLQQLGVTNGADLRAVIATRPTLHLHSPCSAVELAARRAGWQLAMVEQHVEHLSMDAAPEVARDVAKSVAKTLGDRLNKQLCMNSDGEDSGEVIVIANPGRDAKQACTAALAIRDAANTEVSKRNWEDGFNGQGAEPEIAACTKIMIESLADRFEFTACEEVEVAPYIWGGYASDGSIVGILTGRTWT
eukprot:gnl/TRDRNA2_/TRDRNA2_90552_c0_seq1.p1 gnl/TRDRNA2_/TRDRNA2_90552_c0~~gnl/TRDRNA2_/TRDRNA2_90552_c0_seq1.p1  ORF type:complete len:275 (+),score=49.60 gnl/TRDRNA2_/TRDRNA2_90552_c0_seq1:47-826(+)